MTPPTHLGGLIREKNINNLEVGVTKYLKEKYQERPRQGSLRMARMTMLFLCKVLI